MKPANAYLILALAAGASWAAISGPLWTVLGLLMVGFIFLLRGHGGMLIFVGSSILINGVLLGIFTPGQPIGPAALGITIEGLDLGIMGALRISAIIVANVAIIQHLKIPVFLEALHLPPRATGFLAAILISTQTLSADLRGLREVAIMDGAWPAARRQRLAAAANMLPTMILMSWRRAEFRRDALRGAGISVGPRFAPVVAVAALAMAGRLAFVAVPNVALTYVIVFSGGVIFGARVGFWSGFWAMAITDLLISGFAPAVYVNAPAMGALGLLGGWLGRGLSDSPASRFVAASLGIFATLIFSLITDLASWAIIPEFRTSLPQLYVRLAAGLAFNVPAAIANAVLFWLAIGPVTHASKWRPASQPELATTA